MKQLVLRPVYPPPKLDKYSYLSTEAQVTLTALEVKYDHLLKNLQMKESSGYADNYYKSIYDASFKKETGALSFSQYDEHNRILSSNKCNVRNSSEMLKISHLRTEKIICSEIFMTEKPSDEEMAQSILLLTQRTSIPESPLIDFEIDYTYSDDGDQNEKINCKRLKLGQHFSQIASDNVTRELQKNQERSINTHLGYDALVAKDKDKERFSRVDQERSSVLIKDLNKTTTSTMPTSENPLLCVHDVEKVKLSESSPKMWNACGIDLSLNEDPCPNPVPSTKRKKNSQISPENATFDLNVSDCEIEKLDSPLDEILETKEKIAVSKCLNRESEPAVDEGESPLCLGSENVRESPGNLDNLHHQKKKTTYMKLTHLHSNKNAVTPLIQVRCSTSLSRKPATVPKLQNKSKGRQAAFKPPLKNTVKVTSSITRSKLKKDVVNFDNLSYSEQIAALETFKLSHVVMTLVYNDGSALCTMYPPAIEIDKVRQLAILAHQTCYLIMTTLIKNELGRKILELISEKKPTKIICNFKEFLIGLWHFVEQKNENDESPTDWLLPYTNVQDPFIATWLLDPEQSPSSFKHMCDIGGFQLENEDDTWLNCLRATPLLMKNLETKLSIFNQWTLYTEIEMRLIPILACMQRRPIHINVAAFLEFSSILKSKLAKLEEKIYKAVGHEFSINSHIQLRQVLYEELKIDQMLPAKAKVGKTSVAQLKSTSEASLSQFIDVHPLPSLVLEYRQLQKLKSTYVDGMISAVHNGCLTTHWDQTAAATGRLTSSRPNIQAVPKTAITISDYQANFIIGAKTSSEAKINVREPFISRDDFLLLSADFQQIELRILAHLSEDSNLLSTFWQPKSNDVFIALTSKWQGKDMASVTFEDREQTKRVVYSVMYGVGKDKLAQYLKVKPDAAKSLMTSFLEQFPAIDSFTKKCCDFAKAFGYTETICARRRYFPHINSPSPVLRAQAQRQAVNFCVQGSAADICKLAMLSVDEALKNQNIDCRLLFQIHDELIWEVKKNQLQQAKALVQGVMENMKSLCGKFCNLQVPLAVTISSGSSWAHLSSLDNPSQLGC